MQHIPGRATCIVSPIRLLVFVCFFLAPFTSGAQRPQYTIQVSLDTASHTLKGTIDIVYTNRSALRVDSIGLHLYPNAYNGTKTALVRQMLRLGDLSLYHAAKTQLGSITGLAFSTGGNNLATTLDPVNPDIGWIRLDTPLLPGQSVQLTSPFKVHIPVSFSRMGRTRDAYQLTQWYPHIAVLDETGWNVMPYLEQGEFYNDFADYDVTMVVPKGYVIAATGELVSNEAEGRAGRWQFRAENVIDFAWFASPHFELEKRKVTIHGNQSVDLLVYTDTIYPQYWDRAMTYAERAMQFYTDWLGPYPYSQMSVVSTPMSKGGWMEYPMVAQISYTGDAALLDIVMAHEIGHTWLYGALANNERRYPWLDEGLNTFIERRYTETYYPGYDDGSFVPSLRHRLSMPAEEAWQHMTRFSNRMEPPQRDPEYQSSEAYYFSAYLLPAQGLEMLRARMGEDMVKDMFRMYYGDHRFTLVTPVDMRNSFESICDCNLSWLFDEWMEHGHEVDYRIGQFDSKRGVVKLLNKGRGTLPFQITAYNEDQKESELWLDGFHGEKTIQLNTPADRIRLFDAVPGINKIWYSQSRPKSFLPSFALLPTVGSRQKSIISISPFAGHNLTDGWMVGPVFTSGFIPQARMKWIAAPVYGLESHRIRGYAEARYAGDIPGQWFDKFLFSVSAHHFGYLEDPFYGFRDSYVRLSPVVALRIKPDNRRPHLLQWWKYRYVHIGQQYGRGTSVIDTTFVRETRSYGVHELSYQRSSTYALHPYTFSANAQQGKGFLRLNLKYNQHFTGLDKYRGVWVHGFAGWLPVYDNPDAAVHFSINGYGSNGFYATDYTFDQWLGGRTTNTGLYSRQIYERDADLKTLVTSGLSQKWMLGGGASFALPFRFLHFYFDAAWYNSVITQEPQLSYSGGAALVLWKDRFEIYLPLVESQDIRNSLSYEVRDIWHKRISFRANLRLMNPIDVLDKWQLGY